MRLRRRRVGRRERERGAARRERADSRLAGSYRAMRGVTARWASWGQAARTHARKRQGTCGLSRIGAGGSRRPERAALSGSPRVQRRRPTLETRPGDAHAQPPAGAWAWLRRASARVAAQQQQQRFAALPSVPNFPGQMGGARRRIGKRVRCASSGDGVASDGRVQFMRRRGRTRGGGSAR